MRITEMLNHDLCVVSEDFPFDNPYADYLQSVAPSDIPAGCRYLLRDEAWRAEGEESAARFREEMDVKKICAPVINQTLDALE